MEFAITTSSSSSFHPKLKNNLFFLLFLNLSMNAPSPFFYFFEANLGRGRSCAGRTVKLGSSCGAIWPMMGGEGKKVEGRGLGRNCGESVEAEASMPTARPKLGGDCHPDFLCCCCCCCCRFVVDDKAPCSRWKSISFCFLSSVTSGEDEDGAILFLGVAGLFLATVLAATLRLAFCRRGLRVLCRKELLVEAFGVGFALFSKMDPTLVLPDDWVMGVGGFALGISDPDLESLDDDFLEKEAEDGTVRVLGLVATFMSPNENDGSRRRMLIFGDDKEEVVVRDESLRKEDSFGSPC